jgi:hypothetical protein
MEHLGAGAAPGGVMSPPLPPPPDVPGYVTPDNLPPAAQPPQQRRLPGPAGMEQAAAVFAGASANEPPTMAGLENLTITLPAGIPDPDNSRIIDQVRVRELTGYDEEKLSRLDSNANVAVYLTELLDLAVEDIDGRKPTKDDIRNLLIGDRDYLMLAVRKVTYGPTIDFKINCSVCGNDSIATVDIDDDVEIIGLEDRTQRKFTVHTRHGEVTIKMLNGRDQEMYLGGVMSKKTPAELNTIILAKSVLDINGVPTHGKEEAVRALPTGDREKVVEFINEHQPGPALGKEIPVHCATCNTQYPIFLGLGNLFRF